jgi:hypothetical protein
MHKKLHETLILFRGGAFMLIVLARLTLSKIKIKSSFLLFWFSDTPCTGTQQNLPDKI